MEWETSATILHKPTRFALPRAQFRLQCLFRCRGSSPVERGPEKAGVGSSTLPLGTIYFLLLRSKFDFVALVAADAAEPMISRLWK